MEKYVHIFGPLLIIAAVCLVAALDHRVGRSTRQKLKNCKEVERKLQQEREEEARLENERWWSEIQERTRRQEAAQLILQHSGRRRASRRA